MSTMDYDPLSEADAVAISTTWPAQLWPACLILIWHASHAACPCRLRPILSLLLQSITQPRDYAHRLRRPARVGQTLDSPSCARLIDLLVLCICMLCLLSLPHSLIFRPSDDGECRDEDEPRVEGQNCVLCLIEPAKAVPSLCLPLLFGVCDASLRVAVQQVLSVRHVRWEQCIVDRSPE